MKDIADPMPGTTRTVRKFLWFYEHLPVKGSDRKETRWLETVYIDQVYCVLCWCDYGAPVYGWKNVAFDDMVV